MKQTLHVQAILHNNIFLFLFFLFGVSIISCFPFRCFHYFFFGKLLCHWPGRLPDVVVYRLHFPYCKSPSFNCPSVIQTSHAYYTQPTHMAKFQDENRSWDLVAPYFR
ncbi:hypothetical protein B0J13DRAFT_302595 [Dactylonectria estremocensis]|uniref:Uncharacterized protein n=1 Tax=Dactylonectria estremocensis TaxID=1079267 RepID=A0A9P9F1F6_9HYPO|nr:hypothetical protein B0J13DRAFT_302595 [Dactylonectria estremocensis]